MKEPVPPSMERLVLYSFEETDETLATMPLAARRVLDTLGRKLSLEGWLSLGVGDRWRIARAGAAEQVDEGVLSLLEAATPAPGVLASAGEADAASPPEGLSAALGPARPVTDEAWRKLRALDRYALLKWASRPDKLARAYDAILGKAPLSHLTPDGEAHMVDVGSKRETSRRAVAIARVRTTGAVIDAVTAGEVPKGDVLSVARIAGILAAKKAAELIPLCHPVRITRVQVELEPDRGRQELRVKATVEAFDRTGVEMEAMVAASVASLTVYDMIKSADRWATIETVELEAKSGGKSGDVTRPAGRASRE